MYSTYSWPHNRKRIRVSQRSSYLALRIPYFHRQHPQCRRDAPIQNHGPAARDARRNTSSAMSPSLSAAPAPDTTCPVFRSRRDPPGERSRFTPRHHYRPHQPYQLQGLGLLSRSGSSACCTTGSCTSRTRSTSAPGSAMRGATMPSKTPSSTTSSCT